MIRLTFLNDTQRSTTRVYDTDDLAEALIADAEHFRLHPEREGPASNRGPDTWVLGFIVERDAERMPQDEVIEVFRRIASLERIRGPRLEPEGDTSGG